jgi:DNA polymerase/3'-5' exonuclease PolX
LYAACYPHNKKTAVAKLKTEKEIFKFLGYKYLSPNERSSKNLIK